MEYKSRHEDYLKNKSEAHTLSKKLMEMQGELSAKDERCSNLELQISKLNQRCEVRFIVINTLLKTTLKNLKSILLWKFMFLYFNQ